jgi:ectoine hydroxylase-related dioxygenase (phytanoyl-CoA dioxygenase family)
MQHIETFAENSALTRGQEIALEIDQSITVDVALKPGQISLHHCLLAHASGPNTTDNARIGLAVRYLSTHVRQSEGPPMSAILVRGNDAYRHFRTDPAPSGAFTPETIAAHAAAMAPHKVSGYATA